MKTQSQYADQADRFAWRVATPERAAAQDLFDRFHSAPADPAAIETFKAEFTAAHAALVDSLPAASPSVMSGRATTLDEVYGITRESTGLSGTAYDDWILTIWGPEWLA